MGVFRRQYPDGRLGNDCYIDYRLQGKRSKRKIGPHQKLAAQGLHDVELKQIKGESRGIYAEEKLLFADFADEYLAFATGTKAASP